MQVPPTHKRNLQLGEDDGPQTMGNAKWEKAIDYSDVTNENQNHESRKIVNSEENCDFPSRLLNQNTVVIINLYDLHSLFCVRKSLVFRWHLNMTVEAL